MYDESATKSGSIIADMSGIIHHAYIHATCAAGGKSIRRSINDARRWVWVLRATTSQYIRNRGDQHSKALPI